MRFHADTGYPFDTDNHAYRRLLTASSEQLHSVAWTRDDGRPVLLTLYDLATGDAVTIALLDSIEASHAHALLVLHRDGTIHVHGPFGGEVVATAHAPGLAMTDPSIAATLPLPLHHPGRGDLPPDDAWRPLHQQTTRAPPSPRPTNRRKQRCCCSTSSATASPWSAPSSTTRWPWPGSQPASRTRMSTV
jgi:hypothetical protein